MEKKHYQVYLLMFIASFFWAGAFIAGKFGIHSLSPVLLTFFRMGIASLIMMPFLILKMPQQWRLKRNEVKWVLLTGLIGMIGYHLFFFTALSYTTASKSSMINASNPLMTAVLASLFLNEKLTPKRTLYILLALFGVVFILTDGHISHLKSMSLNQGDFIMLIATFCWAVYSIIVKLASRHVPTLKLTAYSFFTCTLMLLPFAIYGLATSPLPVTASPYIAVIYMALFPTVMGYSIQQYAIASIGATQTSLFINLVPIISTLLAVIILHESVSIINIIGAAFIIFAVIAFSRDKNKRISQSRLNQI